MAAYGDPDAGWAVVAMPLALVLGRRSSGSRRCQTGYAVFFWANVVARQLASSSTCRAPSTSTSCTAFFNAGLRKLQPRGELPAMDLEADDGALRRQDDRGPVVEGPARRLHVHRVRALPGGVPGLGDRQAAQPQDADHGHPRDVGRGGGGRAAHPLDPARRRPPSAEQLAEPIVDTAIPYRRGVGLRHLRRMRRGVPGADRARRQDRRPAPQPGARGVRASPRS